MRKFLLLICILSITIGAKAQIRLSKEWRQGVYYDLNGLKHKGWIAWYPAYSGPFASAEDKIYFKPGKNAQDVKVKAVEIQSFIEGADSFVVTKVEKLNHNPFLEVINNYNDSIKLYCSYSMRPSSGMVMGAGAFTGGVGFSSTKKTYYTGSDPDNIVKLEKKNFIEVMSKIMADKPEAVARIQSKKLRLGDMDDLLYFYKYDIMPPAQPPVWRREDY